MFNQIFFLLLTLFSLQIQVLFAEEIPLNPANLKSNWWSLFETIQETSNDPARSFDELLSSLTNQLEDEEDKNAAQRSIKQINTNIESLIAVKRQYASKPVIAWIPKTKYSLSEYIALSDQVRNIEEEIKVEDRELKKQQLFCNNYKKSQALLFTEYQLFSGSPNAKYLQGLQVMAKRIRLGYLEEEVRLSKEYLKNQKRLLERFNSERNLVIERLDLASFDTAQLLEKKRCAKTNYSKEHGRLLQLESESISASGQGPANREQVNILNQKITQSLAKEALYRVEEIYSDLALLFHEMVTNPLPNKNYRQEFKALRDAEENFNEQISIWKETTIDEIDSSGKALLLEGDGRSKKAASLQERNRTALDTMVVLDDLSQELYHVRLLYDIALNTYSKEQSFLSSIWFQIVRAFSAVRSLGFSWMKYTLFEIGETPITLASLAKMVVILLGSFWISKFSRRALVKIARKRDSESEASIYTFGRLLHYAILLIGLLFALVSIGITTSSLALIIGALGIGIGFGLQNMVNNFLCGLVILFERNVKVGDLIELDAGFSGRIMEVNVQNTTIHTADGTDIIVPNSVIIGSRLINWTKDNSYQRLHIPFSTDFSADQDFVKQVITKAALSVPKTLKEGEGVTKPDVWLVRIGESALDFELIVWVSLAGHYGRQSIIASYVSVIEKALRKNEIKIAYPQRELHLKTVSEDIIFSQMRFKQQTTESKVEKKDE